MPTNQPIVATTAMPQEVAKPLPVRTVVTRAAIRPNINQPPTNEGKPAADSATTESVKLSPQLTALARKEQAFRQREQTFKAREKELEEKLAKADKYSQLEAKLKEKDFSEAETLGLNYEEYTKYLLQKNAGEDEATTRMKALEAEIQSLKKGQEENADKEYEATVADYRREIDRLSETPDFLVLKKFEEEGADGKKFSGVDVALQMIIDSSMEDGESVTVEEAVKLTRDLLKERAKRAAALLEEPKAEAAAEEPAPKPAMRTLNQTMQPSGIEKRPHKSLQHMSEAERYAEARRRVLERRQP